jgi:hypothetical protein
VNFQEFSNAKTVADARDRAWRTFQQNIPLDILIAVAPLLYDAVMKWDGSFTATYWIAVGVGLLKTAALVPLAYWMRKRKKPKNS